MSRQQRINAPGTIHHVVNRGVNRQRIFYSDADRVEFGRLIGDVHDRFGVTIIAYCLMDNHYHLIVNCPEGHLSDAMHHVQSVLASHVNERNGRDGPLFKGRFYSAMIDSDRYLLAATRYVERNSLSVAGIDDPANYRWSSVRARLGVKASPAWLDREPILDYFSDVAAYHAFISRGSEGTEPARIATEGLSEIAALMITLFADDDVRTSQLERTVLAAVADSLSQTNRALIGAHLGFDDRQLRRAISRATIRIERDPSVGVIADRLRDHLFDIGALETRHRSAA